MKKNVPVNSKSREEIAEAYSSHPWWYDVRGFFILTFAYRSTLWSQLRFFGKNIAQRHMEIAIGTGTLFELIMKWRKWNKLPVTEIVGIDYAEPMLAGAKHRFASNPEIELRHADVANLPYPDNSFDSANIANAVHCFPDVDAGFQDVLRILKPGGKLAINVLLFPRGPQPLRWIAQKINDWGMAKGILYSPYDPNDIKQRLLKSGAKIVFEEISGNTYNVLAQKPE